MESNEKIIIYDLLGLDASEVKVVNYEVTEKEHVFTVRGKKKSCLCPICHKPTTLRQDLRETLLENKRYHMRFSNGMMVVLKLIKRYFKCKRCKTSFMEKFYFEPKNGQHTIAFEKYVINAR
jgi:transposase